jgi:hypothetical protein
MAAGGVFRDLATALTASRAQAYALVYAVELVLLLATLLALLPLLFGARRAQPQA